MNRRLLTAGLLFVAAVLSAGCGGIRANGSASPATFLMPGIGHADPVARPPGATSIWVVAN